MTRRRCIRRGHKWNSHVPAYVRLPVEFCGRWFCHAERVAPWVEYVSPDMAEGLRRETNRRQQRC